MQKAPEGSRKLPPEGPHGIWKYGQTRSFVFDIHVLLLSHYGWLQQFPRDSNDRDPGGHVESQEQLGLLKLVC